MKKAILLLLLFIPGLLPAKQKVIGYYDLDSVIQLVPQFKQICDSLDRISTYLDNNRIAMMTEYREKRNLFAEDSAKMSEVIRSLKSAELTRFDIELEDFDNRMVVEKDSIWSCYQHKVIEPMNRMIAELARSKSYTAVVAYNFPFFISDDSTRKCITNELAGMALLKISRE